jgi:pimeloyl-ACP methyl ester carboxylesterase
MPRTPSTGADQQHACTERRSTIGVAGTQLEVFHLICASTTRPTIIFLHEGLGSVSLWRNFPQQIVAATGCSALIYSRYGYGQSDVLNESRKADYMHREALDVLPELLAQCKIERPVLFGHSDGASIALIHAGAGHPVGGLILEAPHVFVEDISLHGVARAAQTYRTTDLPEKLARHHRDVHKTFWGWNDIWASDEFRDWNIESYLPSIDCPTLLIQGEQDEYGSVAQIDAITRSVKGAADKHLLANCGHTPHRDQPDITLKLILLFIEAL